MLLYGVLLLVVKRKSKSFHFGELLASILENFGLELVCYLLAAVYKMLLVIEFELRSCGY